MFVKILGWFWICMGILLVLKPEILKKRLQKQAFKKIKKYILALTIVLSVLLIKVALASQGVLAKVILIFGIFGIIKVFFFLKAGAMEKMTEWFADKPLIFFRLGACVHIIIGILILNLK